MIKIKHLMAVPMLAMLALTIPAGCAMSADGQSEQGNDKTAPESEATEESSLGADEQNNALAATYKWRLLLSETCESYCGNCSCVPFPRCSPSNPTGIACSSRRAECYTRTATGVRIYSCQ
jgi:hypothetical protein